MTHFRLYIMLSTAILISVSSCKKDDPPPHSSNTARLNLVSGSPTNSPTYNFKTLGFKTEGWTRYPYIGGEPGVDSMFYSPISLDTVKNYTSENIVEVAVKSKDLILYEAPLWITVSQNDSGYVYEKGETLGRPKNIVLWWIQKRPLTVPDADSVFVSFKYLHD